MTVALTAALTKLNYLIDDSLAGTTTANGASDGTTVVDSGLSKYPDEYFGDPNRNPEWWIYTGTTLRPIKDFVSNTGTIVVYTAFGSQIATSTAYSIHRFDRTKKIEAWNQALIDAWPWFYKRVEDATTLDGTGASANKYTVPVTFTEFPDEIWQKHTSGTVYTFIPITDFVREELSGARYFYADITLSDDIILIGRTYLTAFTTDASTTELTDSQANVIANKAACNLYRRMANTVNATDAGRYEALADRFEQVWNRDKLIHRMPLLASRKLNFGWLA
jgi:hypothetical protein